MLLKLLLGQMLFLPLIYGSNITLKSSTRTTDDTVLLNNVSSDKTKITIPAEGGAITQIDTNLTLRKDNINTLMDLEEESGRNRPIVPRKGVHLNESDLAKAKSSDMNHQVENKINNTIERKNSTHLLNISRVDSTVHKNNSKNHKPLVLSYEALHGANQGVPSAPISSSKTLVSDQIPNPNSDHMKGQTIDGNHPGMIMPVVITILTVPLFAVLGFMAWRRGQEAWKNRHYKRMDFLLDGMYND